MTLAALLVAQRIWPPVAPAAGLIPARGRTSVRAEIRRLMTNPRWLHFLAGRETVSINL